MTDRVIASRPSLEQVNAIVDFMEKHPVLAAGQMRGVDGREESKKLWFKLTRIVNNIDGPNRPMKSWIKFWADKKSTVRSKVLEGGGDANSLSSNIEKKIWDLFLANNDSLKSCSKYLGCRGSVKQESSFVNEASYNEDSMEQDHTEAELVTFEEPLAFDGAPAFETTVDADDKQIAIMEKLVKVMSDQAAAMAQLAHATHVNAQAMERLADASQIQARAMDRLANTFETIGAATHDVRNAIVDIDGTMKRFYTTSPT